MLHYCYRPMPVGLDHCLPKREESTSTRGRNRNNGIDWRDRENDPSSAFDLAGEDELSPDQDFAETAFDGANGSAEPQL